MVSESMQDYIDELEIEETNLSPRVVYASEEPPELYPMQEWITLFDNRGDISYPTDYLYEIKLILKEHFIVHQLGEQYFVQEIHMKVYSQKSDESEKKLVFNGPVYADIDYIFNDEVVIRFKTLDLEGFFLDGVCRTYYFVGVL